MTEKLFTGTLNHNQKTKIIFHLKIIVFTAVKNCCILHGRVCVMPSIKLFCTVKNVYFNTSCSCKLGADLRLILVNALQKISENIVFLYIVL